jgi:hypothetical protein
MSTIATRTIKGAVPGLKSAEFDFKTDSSNTAGLKFTILIFTFGATHKSESTNDVTFSYVVPPPPTKPLKMSMTTFLGMVQKSKQSKPKDFSQDLITTLQQAAQQIELTRSVGAAQFKTLTVSLAYGVTWDFNASPSLPISLVTLGGTLDHSRADTQTLKLTFEDPAPSTISSKLRDLTH